MIIKLQNKKTTAVLAISIERDKAEKILQNAKWIAAHISSTHADMLLYDLHIAIPSLNISDVKAILEAYDPNSEDKIAFFVNICNILARDEGRVFSILPSTDFFI